MRDINYAYGYFSTFPCHQILNRFDKHVVHENAVGGSSKISFPLAKAVSEWDMPGIEPGPLGWHTSALTNELEEVDLMKVTFGLRKHCNFFHVCMLQND
jgi:hypothetical protein